MCRCLYMHTFTLVMHPSIPSMTEHTHAVDGVCTDPISPSWPEHRCAMYMDATNQPGCETGQLAVRTCALKTQHSCHTCECIPCLQFHPHQPTRQSTSHTTSICHLNTDVEDASDGCGRSIFRVCVKMADESGLGTRLPTQLVCIMTRALLLRQPHHALRKVSHYPLQTAQWYIGNITHAILTSAAQV